MTLLRLQGCMPCYIDGMVMEQLAELQKAPPTQSSGGRSHSMHTRMWTNDHHQVAHMPAMGKLQRVAKVQTLTVEPP